MPKFYSKNVPNVILFWCKVYSLKSVGIVTECIGDHNDTNKRNNCLDSDKTKN